MKLHLKFIFTFLVICLSLKASAQYNFYFGNIHAHTSFSDGNKDSSTTHYESPAEDYKYAKASQHFDFLGISEHNHSKAGMHLASYAKGLAEANAANEDGKFVCLYGMEYGVIKNGGHVVIYGFDKLIGWEPGNYDIQSPKFDYENLFKLIAANPKAFATLAHPANTDYNGLITKPWDAIADQAIVGVAISSGPAFSEKTDYSDKAPLSYYAYYKKLLALGYRIGPTMDHDNHYTTFGRMSTTRTVILAKTLSRDSLMAAYKADRFYASTDWDTRVDFKVNGAPMGSSLQNVTAVKISATVSDPDAGDNVKTINIMYGKPGSGEQPTILTTVINNGTISNTQELESGDDYYYYLDITQVDGDRIITAPVWVNYQSQVQKAQTFSIQSPPPGNFLKPHIIMNPTLTFYITLIVMTIIVIILGACSNMLKDPGPEIKQAFSWSRVQLAWWMVIVLATFVTVVLCTGDAPELNGSVIILLGISAATTVAGSAIDVADTKAKLNLGRFSNSKGFIYDILSDDNGVSIHRFQTLCFNVAFGFWFIVKVIENLHGLPQISPNEVMPVIADNNLVLIGLSSATYAALKTTENKS